MVVHSVASSGQARSDTFMFIIILKFVSRTKRRTPLMATQLHVFQRQPDLDCRGCTRNALDPEFTAVQFSEPLANHQTKTRALLLVNTSFKLHISTDEGDLLL